MAGGETIKPCLTFTRGVAMLASSPVLIVGAGPTGLTAAMELSRQGVPIRLVDKASTFSDTSRALAVQARTLELMQQRGLADEMTRIGNPGRAATLYSAGKTLGRLDLSLIQSRFSLHSAAAAIGDRTYPSRAAPTAGHPSRARYGDDCLLAESF